MHDRVTIRKRKFEVKRAKVKATGNENVKIVFRAYFREQEAKLSLGQPGRTASPAI